MIDTLDRVMLAICRVCLWLGAASAGAIFLLLAGSSVKRYVLGSPWPFTEELAGLLFVVTSFAAVPYGAFRAQHIRILVVWRRLPVRAGTWLGVLGDLLGVAVLGVVVLQMVAFAEYSREVGARSEVSQLLLWPWMYCMPLALTLLAAVLALKALHRAVEACHGRFVSLSAGASLD